MPLITAPYLSRTVGASGVGTYAYYYAIAHYFYIFGKMGLNNYGTREIAINRDEPAKRNYTFTSIYIQQLIISFLVMLLYIVFCLINVSNDIIIPALLGIYTLGCLFDIDWLYLGIEKFDKIAIKNIIVKVISLILIFMFVKNSNDLWKYTLVMSLGMFIGFLTLWIGVRKNVKFVKVSLKDSLKHIKPNMILLFPVLAANVYRYMDKVMVGKISGMTELGYYDSAEKIIYAISSFITAFNNIMMPRCTNLVIKNKIKKCKEYINKTMQFLFFIIMGMGFVILGLSKITVLVVFGKEFSSSIILLQTLSITLVFMTWSDVIRSLWILPHKKDKIFLLTITTGAIINIILNMILIPRYGSWGACIATIFAEMSVPIVQYLYFRKELDFKRIFKNQIIFLVAGIITAVLLNNIQIYFNINVINLCILLLVGISIYLCICILLYFIFKRKQLDEYITIGKNFINERIVVKNR